MKIPLNSLSSVSIGIPAFNEEANIGFLIEDLLIQNQSKYSIKKIIISSDGSTDRTIQILKGFRNKKIQILDNKKREGVAKRENQIFEKANSNILVLLNADIRIKDHKFLEKIVLEMSSKKVDLISANAKELEPKLFFEKVLLISTRIKNFAFERYNHGKNVYTCHGQARAFSKRLYKSLHFKSSIGEDAFSYFYCIKNGFTYSFVKNTETIYKLPSTLKDHEKQSIRFFQSQKLLENDFDKQFIVSEYSIPRSLLIKGALTTLEKFPIYTILYLGIVIYLKIKSLLVNKIEDMWEISTTSKGIKI